ncbi:sulfatase family protein [Poriferisphaera sp. WC338]|uniref:sulfatase family protein n=1 Tax=Poriferisphaera sp. WC338 TaxID=3425129 RepID=UPI003D815CED
MPSTRNRPNLIYVFCDQLRAQSLGFMEQDIVHTPNIDRFSQESLTLTHAVSNYPVCSPHRAMFMSGKYPLSNGVILNCHSGTSDLGIYLKTEERCWSDVLHDKGYSLGYIGKWHLETPHKPFADTQELAVGEDPFWNEWTPPERRHGFDYWHAYNTSGAHMTPEYWTTSGSRDEITRIKQWSPEYEVGKAIDYLNNTDGSYRNPDQPFALVWSINPPHGYYKEYPQKYREFYEKYSTEELCNRPSIPPADEERGQLYREYIRDYLSMITGVDEQFGKLLQAIDELNLSDDTIVVFTSDHGDCLGIHGHYDNKNNHFEEAMHVPFIIRYPDVLEARQDDLLLSSPDIYPTLIDLMGYKNRIPSQVEGQSLADAMKDCNAERPTSQFYIRVPYPGDPRYGKRGVRTHRYKLMIDQTKDKSPRRVELYDLQEDPYEMSNIAWLRPNLIKQLVKDELTPWLKHTKDPWQVPEYDPFTEM